MTGISLGCGDPVTLAALEPGQTVLDLGSGGGIDCFLAAKQVGPSGHVIGVDANGGKVTVIVEIVDGSQTVRGEGTVRAERAW